MKRTFKIIGLSMVVAAILALAIVESVSAASNNPGTGTQTQNQRWECLCREQPCGERVYGDCDLINHAYNYDYSYSSPGPH